VRQASQVRPLPGARELLAYLSDVGAPWAVATSGRTDTARSALTMLGLGPDVPVVTRNQLEHAKPDPDLFVEAARRLGVAVSASVVVGGSVPDQLTLARALRWARSAVTPTA